MKAIETARQKLGRIWREAWRPPDRRPPWAWCEDHITSIPYSPVPGRFRSDNSPWMREPMEALVDPKIRLVSIIAAIQSGKTSVGELRVCYIKKNGKWIWERIGSRDQHYFDCEGMQVTAAFMLKLIGQEPLKESEPVDDESEAS